MTAVKMVGWMSIIQTRLPAVKTPRATEYSLTLRATPFNTMGPTYSKMTRTTLASSSKRIKPSWRMRNALRMINLQFVLAKVYTIIA